MNYYFHTNAINVKIKFTIRKKKITIVKKKNYITDIWYIFTHLKLIIYFVYTNKLNHWIQY